MEVTRKKPKRWIEPVHDPVLRQLCRSKTLDELVVAMDFSKGTISARLRAMNLKAKHPDMRQSRAARQKQAEQDECLAIQPEAGCLAKAESVLYRRFFVRNGERYLIGERVPCSTDRFMREANKVRKAAGLPPLGNNPAWHV